MQLNLTQQTLDAIITGMIGTGDAFDPAATFAGVATGITPSGLSTVLADVTQAVGDIAARKEVTTWSGPFLLQNGQQVYESGILRFQLGDSDAPQTIAVVYIATSATDGDLIGWWVLDTPIPLTVPDDEVAFVIRITGPVAGPWDVSVVWDG